MTELILAGSIPGVAGAAVMLASGFTLIPVGDVGVKHFLGRVDAKVLDVSVRDIQAPPTVKDAIEAKLAREQQVAAEPLQTEIIHVIRCRPSHGETRPNEASVA
jgi:hypothetical protein